ncbi:hypothetical protein EON65_23470 [archaeon]|nr:MAG: hypothetical protein EON65_23470 [archaeon]
MDAVEKMNLDAAPRARRTTGLVSHCTCHSIPHTYTHIHIHKHTHPSYPSVFLDVLQGRSQGHEGRVQSP